MVKLKIKKSPNFRRNNEFDIENQNTDLSNVREGRTECNTFLIFLVVLFIMLCAFVAMQHSKLSELLGESISDTTLNRFIKNDISISKLVDATPVPSVLETEYLEISFKNNIPKVTQEPNLNMVANVIEVAFSQDAFDTLFTKLNEVGYLKIKAFPDDTVTAVVQCSTSKGNLTIDVRSNWAPIGAARYLDLVKHKFFENLPFFRVCPRYITQFGVKYRDPDTLPVPCSGIEDDPSLWGVRDMDFGYLFYAGSGPNSRGCQMVLALCEMDGCKVTTLGSTHWEVPLGSVRKDGFDVLREIARSGFPYPKLEMAGQHEHATGPNQGE